MPSLRFRSLFFNSRCEQSDADMEVPFEIFFEQFESRLRSMRVL